MHREEERLSSEEYIHTIRHGSEELVDHSSLQAMLQYYTGDVSNAYLYVCSLDIVFYVLLSA